MWVIVILLVIIILYYFYTNNQIKSNNDKYIEKFDQLFQQIEQNNIKNQHVIQLLDDMAFQDVIIYENENGRLGIDKCLENKDGHCVEYGIAGIAYYYPAIKSNKYYGEIINLHPIQKETENKSLIYPSLR